MKHTLIGMAQANIVVRAQMLTTWLVQVPMSIYLGLYSTVAPGVFGFVVGSACGNLASFMLLGFAVWKSDWKQLSDDAWERSHH